MRGQPAHSGGAACGRESGRPSWRRTRETEALLGRCKDPSASRGMRSGSRTRVPLSPAGRGWRWKQGPEPSSTGAGGGRRQGAATHRSCHSQGPRLAAQEAAPGTPGGHDSRASSVPGQARLLRAGPPGRVSQGALSFPLAMRGCPRLSGCWLAAPMPTFFNAPVSSPKNFTLQRGP